MHRGRSETGVRRRDGFSDCWDSAEGGISADGQGHLHKYFRSGRRTPQGARARFGLPRWPELGALSLRALGGGGGLEALRHPAGACPVQSALQSALPPPWLGFPFRAHFSAWASRSPAPGWGQGPGAQPGARRVTGARRSEAGQEGQRGCVFSSDVRKCHEARVVLAREQSAPTGRGRPEATPPRAPCPSNPGTKESPRRCCTCCYCLRAPFRRPASHTPRPPNQGVAPRCYWRSRSSGRHPARWRWPGPRDEPSELVGPDASAVALARPPTWRTPWPAFRLPLQGPRSHPGSTLSLHLSQLLPGTPVSTVAKSGEKGSRGLRGR